MRLLLGATKAGLFCTHTGAPVIVISSCFVFTRVRQCTMTSGQAPAAADAAQLVAQQAAATGDRQQQDAECVELALSWRMCYKLALDRCIGLCQSALDHHHHHQITKLSHSINAIGPPPHWSALDVLACVFHTLKKKRGYRVCSSGYAATDTS
jgi:hypothetical protein